MISNGVGIDSTQTVAATTRIFDIRGTSRPLTVRLAIAAGETLTIATSTIVAALADENHASWTVIRTRNGAYHTETFISTSTSLVGIRVRRTAGAVGTSTARVFSILRPVEPRYDPFIDRASVGTDDVRRLYDQATMGPTFGQAQAFTGTFGQWIATQIAEPVPTIPAVQPSLNANNINLRGVTEVLWKHWTDSSATQQLRSRVAWALSQIVVAGPAGGSGNPNLRSWHQRMLEAALGNFRDVLDLACMHRAMGFYLNNCGNSAWNIAPSQNFARELLQLFSMGNDALNLDGSVVRDANGAAVRAYSQTDVGAAARYLSGWNVPFPGNHLPGELGSPANGDMMTSKSLTQNLAFNGDTTPWPLFGKTSVDYPSFATLADPSNAEIIARKDAVIDIIMAQQTTGVYICKQLIQKLVTDTPSPQYIRRVVAAWQNNGSGVVGSLSAVVRAILLDAEARGQTKPQTFGRAQEWVLTNTRRCRYAEWVPITLADSNAYMWATDLSSPPVQVLYRETQIPGQPVSVFNDYPFSYTALGAEAPAAYMWGAPQVQANIGITMSASNSLANPSAMTTFDPTGRWLVSGLITVYDAAFAAEPGDATAKALAGHNAIIDRCYADLHQGRLPSTDERTQIVGLMTDLLGQSRVTRERCCYLINIVLAVPNAAIVQ